MTCPSGVLVILDMGYMRMWSGTNPPRPIFDGTEDPARQASLLSARDYVIVGRDADQVARIANLQALHFLYDIPDDGLEKVAAKIRDVAAKHGLEAWIEAEPRRISHRERAQRAAEVGGGDFVMGVPGSSP